MRKRRIAALGAGALALSLGGLIGLGLQEAVRDPVVRSTTVALPSLPKQERPYRVALLSDIHIGNRAMGPERLERIVAQVNGTRPDLVVITGDFVNGHGGKIDSDPAALTKPLAKLNVTDGVIAVMGNHDHWTDRAAVERALRSAGVTTLSNQAAQRGPLMILGIDDRYTTHADLAATLSSAAGLQGIPVAINHSPDLAPELPAQIQLLLAGHTHCGQVVLPMIGSLAPIFGKLVGDRHYYQARYECGLVREGGRTTVVSAGLGSGSIPLRIGAPPDWWIIGVTGQ